MTWSKNILEERDAPHQTNLGVMDPAFYPILDIAAHLVHPIHSGGMASMDSQSLLCVTTGRISTLFPKITESDSFTQINDGKLDTHSMRKLLTTCAWRNDCCCDDVDARGR